MGFAEFERLFKSEEDVDFTKWVCQRAYSVLDNLNIESKDKFDIRVEQLKNVFCALVEIMSAFSKVETGKERFSKENITMRKEIAQKVNPNWKFRENV